MYINSKITKEEGFTLEEYTIYANEYLKKDTKAYYTLDYYGGEYSEDTKFILVLKNMFDNYNVSALNNARDKAETILKQALSEIMKKEKLIICTVVAIPRAKAYNTYLPQQLYLIDAISNAAQSFNNVIDGTTYIRRHINTKTTHIRSRDIGRTTAQGKIPNVKNANDGPEPYPGITKDTCKINTSYIKGQTVILVDDIYTKTCNVDEDCIQALYDAGAKEVIFYSFAKTARR